MTEMAMFPLGSVLLPGALLPLHVFEPRYQVLVRRCLDEPEDFGVVMIERGSEVGGDDERSDIGTSARIVDSEEQPDGRWLVAAVGIERLRILRWLPDDPHPVADVEPWHDAEAVGSVDSEIADLVTMLHRIFAMVGELGHATPRLDFDFDFDPEPSMATFQVANLAPLGPFDRQRVLRAEGPTDRATLLSELLAEQELLLRAELGGP